MTVISESKKKMENFQIKMLYPTVFTCAVNDHFELLILLKICTLLAYYYQLNKVNIVVSST